jgi:hypothetical protein
MSVVPGVIIEEVSVEEVEAVLLVSLDDELSAEELSKLVL